LLARAGDAAAARVAFERASGLTVDPVSKADLARHSQAVIAVDAGDLSCEEMRDAPHSTC
jgi:hypothetical protein